MILTQSQLENRSIEELIEELTQFPNFLEKFNKFTLKYLP